MMAGVIVRSQEELDAALADPDVTVVVIDSPPYVSLDIGATFGKRVSVRGQSLVRHIGDDAEIFEVSGYTTFENVDGRPTFVNVTGRPRFVNVTGRPRFVDVTGAPRFENVHGTPLFVNVSGAPLFERVGAGVTIKKASDYTILKQVHKNATLLNVGSDVTVEWAA